MKNEERGNWYLLTGLILGFVLGLLYAWLVQPVKFVDTSPTDLRADFRDQYRALIAAAYSANGDLVRARARLELLGDQDIYRALSEQAQRSLAEQGSSPQAQALGLLAIALGQEGSGFPVPTNQPERRTAPPGPTSTMPSSEIPPAASATASFTSAPTLTSSPTWEAPEQTPAGVQVTTPEITPSSGVGGSLTQPSISGSTNTVAPTRMLTPTPGGPFVLLSQEKICDTKLSNPLIQVEALNIQSQPVPGVLVIVSWESGEERFFTGLKPEKGLGYADFNPAPGIVYTLRLEEAGKPVTDLTAAKCQEPSGESFWGAWLIRFVQP